MAGKSANHSGGVHESDVCSMLQNRGLQYHRWFHLEKMRCSLNKQPVLDVWCPGFPGFARGLGLQCKVQDSPGSVNDKIIKVIVDIKEWYGHEYPCAIVVEGDTNESRAMLAAAKEHADGHRLIGGFDLSDFRIFLNRKCGLASAVPARRDYNPDQLEFWK